MNILVVSPYGLYGDLSSSFVHAQVKAYVSLGCRVRVLIPMPFGKNHDGHRILPFWKQTVRDNVELCYVRFVSLSRYGEKRFNTCSAVFSARSQLQHLVQDFKTDVIHAHTLGLASELGVYLKSVLKCPLVVTTHGSDTASPLAHGFSNELRKQADKADKIVAVSTKLQEKLHTCGTKTKLCTILNGFQPHRLEPQTRNPFGMIQVGNLVQSKRVDVTICALSLLCRQYPEMTLTVIGQGPLRQEMDLLCDELKISDRITFMGKKPNDVVLQNMCGATFFVMVSKPEGFGIVYLEAMAAGCITIGTEDEGIADLIVSGENGFLVPADDPSAIANVIQYCLNNPNKAAAIARRGQQAAQGLTWEKNAKQYVALFEELIDSCKNC